MLTDRLVNKKVIDKDDYEIYQFGFLQLLRDVISVGSVIIAGILFRELLECFVYMICFMVLRSYAGGYHASTPFRCYLLTMTVSIIILSACKYLHLESFLYVIMGMISSVAIYVNSPVASEEKPLDADEVVLYKRKSRIALFCECFFAMVFFFFGKTKLFICIVYVLIALCMSQIAALLKK